MMALNPGLKGETWCTRCSRHKVHCGDSGFARMTGAGEGLGPKLCPDAGDLLAEAVEGAVVEDDEVALRGFFVVGDHL